MENKTKSVALSRGFIAGAALTLVLFLLYMASPRLMLHPVVMWGTLLFYGAGMVMACRGDRRSAAGPFPFRQALKSAFLAFIATNVVYYAFYFVLVNYHDPGLLETQREVLIENTRRMAVWLRQDISEETIEELREQDMRFTPGVAMLSFAGSLIRGFLLACLIALLMRREGKVWA
jgi:hypothetical protein